MVGFFGGAPYLIDSFHKIDPSLWKNKNELNKLMKSPGMVEKYIQKDLRANEQLKYRAIAFFSKMKDLHSIVLKSTSAFGIVNIIVVFLSFFKAFNNFLTSLRIKRWMIDHVY